MAERLVTPEPDRAIWEFLQAKTGVQSAGLIPANHKSLNEFIRVRLGGGADVDVARAQPTVFVEVYAAKVGRAKILSLDCDSWLRWAALEGWLLAIPVLRIDTISSPQELPDPLTDQARFTATYAPVLRRAAAIVP